MNQKTIDATDLQNQNLLLQFWAPWCHSCASVVWDLDPIISQAKDIRFLSINIDEDHVAAKKYIVKHKLYKKYENSFYTSPSKNLLQGLEVDSVPTIVIVNKAGDVVHYSTSHIDAANSQAIKQAIKKL